jgi:predicted enzyme related to lactoylglutathione lyase
VVQPDKATFPADHMIGSRLGVCVLRKIDCVLVRVADLDGGADFYARLLGLRVLWRDESSVGMGLPETDAEIVLHTMDLPPEWAVHYLVDDVRATVTAWQEAGRAVSREPFEIAVGWCAALADPYGNAVCILDLSKGTRT